MIDARMENIRNAPGADRNWIIEVLLAILLTTGFFLGPLKLLHVGWLSYLIADLLAVLILLFTFLQRLSGRKPLFADSPLSLPILLLVALCTLELANPEAPFVRSVLGLRSWVLYLGFYFVGLYVCRSLAQLQRLYALLLILGSVTAIYGIYQWRAGPDSFATWSEEYGRYAQLMFAGEQSRRVFRAFSTFVLPNTFAVNMGFLMLLAFSVLSSSSLALRWRGGAFLAFAVMGIGIAASGTRAPVVQLLLSAGMGVILLPGSGRRIKSGITALAMSGVVLVAVVLVVGPTVNYRFATIFDPEAFFWKWFLPLNRGLGIALTHPFGVGLGYTAGVPQFLSSSALQGLETKSIDSGYGAVAAELGLVGLALFAYVAFRVAREGIRTWQSLPPGPHRDLLFGPALLAATYPILAVIAQPQATIPNSIYFWLLIGMLMKAPLLTRELDANHLLRAQMHAGQ